MMSNISSLTILLAFLCQFSEAVVHDGKARPGKRWGVIVSGAQGWDNYFSQSNTCHAYHVLRNGGIPAENIIHMNYDDIANCEKNPVKNNLINTLNGTNVYEGCVIDYRGEDVLPEVFIHVLTGNKTGVQTLTGKQGKVLESGPNDEIFLYMNDHGAEEIFWFPTKMLFAINLYNALMEMHQKKMYKQMVIYMDSCLSGSMFNVFLPEDWNIYAVTSAKPNEDAFLSCYDDHRGIFLSSMFSYTWMYSTDQLERDEVSLDQLFEKSYNACIHFQNGSHPQQYGNVSLNKYSINRFMGDNTGTNKSHVCSSYPPWDRKTLESLRNEIQLPFEEDVLSPEFLQRPPVDMGAVATLIRRIASNTTSQKDKESMKVELNFSAKVKVVAEQLIGSIVKNVTGSGEELSFKNRPKSVDVARDCYYQAMERITSECPVLLPQRFPFVNRNLRSLMKLCKTIGTETIMDAITIYSCALTGCRMSEFTQ